MKNIKTLQSFLAVAYKLGILRTNSFTNSGTRKSFQNSVWLIPLLLLIPLVLVGQTLDKSVYFEYGEKFYYEIHSMSSESTDSTRFMVLFRIRFDAMNFTRTKVDQMAKGAFLSLPVLYVEALNEEGIITSSKRWFDTVFAENYNQTISKEIFVHGVLEMDIPPGNYKFLLELGSSSAPRAIKMKSDTIRGINFQKETALSTPIFTKVIENKNIHNNLPSKVTPLIANGDIPFSFDARAVISTGSFPENTEFTYTIERLGDLSLKKPYPRTGNGFSKAAQTRVQSPRNIVIKNQYNNAIELLIEQQASSVETPSNKPLPGVLDFVLETHDLSEGIYRLEVYSSHSQDTLHYPFKVIWDTKPLSLRQTRYAIDILKYIATEDEMDYINSGSLKDKKEKLIKFWESRDPTQETAYNEAMAEYYTRVDYAYFNFKNIKMKDGAKTDQGKIYILHGAPTDIDRKFTPGENAMEIWKYANNVKKTFTFEATSPGNFELRSIDDINVKRQ